MAGAYLAITCMTSAMTRNQVISFILSVVVCLFLILAGWPPVTQFLDPLDMPWLRDLAASFSVMTQYDGFGKGVVALRSLVYFASVIGFCLFTTGVILRTHRAG